MSFSNFIPVQPKKCQCISFNKKGFIVESDNSLFNTGFLMGNPVTFQFPFIKKIFKKLQSLKTTDEPLFFTNIKMHLSEYGELRISHAAQLMQIASNCAAGRLHILGPRPIRHVSDLVKH